MVLNIEPNCTPLLLAWLLTQINGGGPEKNQRHHALRFVV